MATAGRKPKLTETLIEHIYKFIKAGMTIKRASQLVGVSEGTFYAWKSKGEKAKSGIYLKFHEVLKRAEAESEAILLNRIQQASVGGAEITESRITKKLSDRGEEVIEETIVTKKAAPVWQASAWMLERRFPERYGRFIQAAKTDQRESIDDVSDFLEQARKESGEEDPPVGE